MPKQIYQLQLAEDGKELDIHGTPMFPCACYDIDVRRNALQEVPWHWHEEIEVICLIHGKGTAYVDQTAYPMKEGDGLFINTNALHSLFMEEGQPCQVHSFVFSPEILYGTAGSLFEQRYVKPLLDAPARGIWLTPQIPSHKQAIRHIEEAFLAYASEEFGWEMLVRAHLSQLWVQVAASQIRPLGEAPATETSDTHRLKDMLAYLNGHYQEDINLTDLARIAHVSERECLRCFQRTIGIPPMKYLQKLRISKACVLLADTATPITDISGQCGFESPSYFSQIFRRLVGVTPKQYRQQSTLH
ncbi:MAG: helix-turn-helix domain-containing protein [Blautia sp.]